MTVLERVMLTIAAIAASLLWLACVTALSIGLFKWGAQWSRYWKTDAGLALSVVGTLAPAILLIARRRRRNDAE